MIGYDFVLVQMTKINARVLWHFKSEQCTHPSGSCIVLWKNKRIDFCHLHVNKIISVIHLIHTRHHYTLMAYVYKVKLHNLIHIKLYE